MTSSSSLSTASTQESSQENLSDTLNAAVRSLPVESSSTETAIDDEPKMLPAGNSLKDSPRSAASNRRRRGKGSRKSVSSAVAAVLLNSYDANFNQKNVFKRLGSSAIRERPNRSSPATTPGIRRPRVPSSKESSPQAANTSYEHETINITADELNHMKPFSKGDDQNFPSYTKSALSDKSNGLCFPLIYVTPAGAISIVLSAEVIVETGVDHSIRVVRHGDFSAYVNGQGTSSSIVHLNARILHTSATGTVPMNVVGRFMSSTHDKVCILGNNGVLFTMDHLREAYLVSSGSKGASSVMADCFQFPRLSSDYTMHQFYANTQTGAAYIPLCKEIVDLAIYDRRADGSLLMQINDMTIRHPINGDVTIDARPRHISCSADGSVHVRTPHIDMGVQMNGSAFIKFGQKRVHVSVSGMVVSDGSSCTSMDHCGRILLST